MTFLIVDLWQSCVCFIRSGVTQCTLLMVLSVDRMCQRGYTQCSGHTLVHLCTASLQKPYSTAGLLFPSRCRSATILLTNFERHYELRTSIYVEHLTNGSEWWCWSGLKLQYCKGCNLETIANFKKSVTFSVFRELILYYWKKSLTKFETSCAGFSKNYQYGHFSHSVPDSSFPLWWHKVYH